MRLALYEPEIPQNAGAILRLAACLGVEVNIIEPCGFVLSNAKLRRAGMDYLDAARMVRHRSWPAFVAARAPGRLVLLTTGARKSYVEFRYRADDTLLLGGESAGVPGAVHDAADARLRIPMADGMRSLNVALAAAMVLGEALRQTGELPAGASAGASK